MLTVIQYIVPLTVLSFTYWKVLCNVLHRKLYALIFTGWRSFAEEGKRRGSATLQKYRGEKEGSDYFQPHVGCGSALADNAFIPDDNSGQTPFQASKMLALVVAIFMFVWLPYHCFFLLSGFLTTIE